MNDFYVVTLDSIYHVYVEQNAPVAEKISIRERNKKTTPVGTRWSGDIMLMTLNGLLVCHTTPFGFMITAKTKPIVGLFLEKEMAFVCGNTKHLYAFDRRWNKELLDVFAVIGPNNPLFPAGQITIYTPPPTNDPENIN